MVIQESSYRAPLNFHGNVNQSILRGYIGPELEIDGPAFSEGEEYVECPDCGGRCCGGGEWVTTDPELSVYEFSKQIANMFDYVDHEEHVVFKWDCSIEGVELNFQPATYEHIVGEQRTALSEMFRLIRWNELNNWRHNAGMHVHVSYTAFANDDHVKKFVQLVELLFDKIYEFSGRSSYSYCHACGIDPSLDEAEFKRRYYEAGKHRVKMQAVNTSHRDTLEVRIFNAPDNVDRYIANIQMCVVLVQLSKARRVTKMTWENVKDTARLLGFAELTAIIG